MSIVKQMGFLDFLEDVPVVGDFYDVGAGVVNGGVGAVNGIVGAGSDLFNSSVNLTKNLANAGGNIATGLGSFLGDGSTWTIIVYGGAALIVYKIVSDSRK